MFLKRGFLYSVILLLVLLFSVNIFAGVTGKITGRVIDTQTKVGLPGVNVIITELQIGAATDADGYYFILNVPVGQYSVNAQMITYASVIMEKVKVSADIATTVNFTLSPQAIQVEGVTVTATQKLVETNVTSKQRTIDQEFLSEMTGSSVMEVVATNAGISGEGTELHVRGGRTDEVGYMVDGMSITDPVNKSLGATINRNAVAEIKVMTGGFSAEYGEAMSGIINIVTKEGGKAFNGQLKYEGNSFLPEAMNYGDNRMEFSLGGPVISENIRFFLSGDMSSTNDWSPRFHDTPDYFYIGDSAFVWDVPSFTGAFEYDSLSDSMLWVIDTSYTNYVWSDDSVPYFDFEYDTFYSDSNIWVYDTTVIDSVTLQIDSTYSPISFIELRYPNIDTVVENKYGPDYWDNLGPAMLHHKSHEYHGQLKFTVKPTNNLKINFGGFFSHQSLQSYTNDLKYNLEKYRSQNKDGYQVNTVINWMLNERNFLTLTGNYFYTKTTVGPEFSDPIYYYNDDNNLDSFVPEGPAIPEWYEFWKSYVITDTTAFQNIPSNDSRWEYNNPWGTKTSNQYIHPNYYGYMNYRYSNYFAVKGDWTSQIGRFHEMKTGFEFKRFELYQWDLYLPWDPNPFEDNYHTYPIQMAGYVQDKMEFEGMVINLGIRFDYIASNTPYYVDPLNVAEPIYIDSFTVDPITGDSTFIGTFANTNPDSSDWNVQVAQPKYQVSPRLGISHPITETSVLHFNYGHFFQTPQMDYLFSGIGVNIAKRGNSIIGDPNLGAERTIAYEIGIATQIGADMAIDFTAYYKDIFGLIGTRKVYSIPQTYYSYQNIEYGNVKGFEIAFQKGSKYFSGNIAYTLSFAKGTASDSWDGYNTSYHQTDPVTGEGGQMPKIPYYLDYDQRHLLNFVLTFRMPEGELPVYADNWSITINNSIASGTPYTPENSKGGQTGATNSERMPWIINNDLKFRKGFALGPITPNFYVQVTNLFNIKNVDDVYATTGLPDNDGSVEDLNINTFTAEYEIGDYGYDVRRDLDKDGICTGEENYTALVASMEDNLNDPTNFSAPRIITIGLEFSF